MEQIQMTQIGTNNYMYYMEGDEIKPCKICQIYPDSKFVDIVCIDEDYKCIKRVNHSIELKPIEVCSNIIEEMGFSLICRKENPQTYGHPDNIVYDLIYKDKISMMVVLINNLYYILLHDTTIYSKTDFPLCVHHLQNLKTNIGENKSLDDVSLINLLKNKVLPASLH